MKTFTAEERKKFILDYVKKNEFVDITYLKNTLDVSEMTIRRDLRKLEANNSLVRVLGGARSIPSGMYEDPVEKRVKFHAEEKERIARYAASLVNEGDSIFMDASSTVYAMVEYLDVHTTVITNNISICLKLKDKQRIDVILVGGDLRKSAMSLVGIDAIRMLENYYVDKAFLSSKAVDLVHGISDATRDEAEVKKAMIRSSGETYFLVDHYKLENRAFYKVCSLDEITALIVDESKETYVEEFISECKRKNQHVYCVKEDMLTKKEGV